MYLYIIFTVDHCRSLYPEFTMKRNEARHMCTQYTLSCCCIQSVCLSSRNCLCLSS